MTSLQKSFRNKLFGMGLVIGVLWFMVFGLGVYKAVAQTHDQAAVETEKVMHAEGEKNTDPGVMKFAFLAAAIAVGVGSLGGGAAVGYVGAAAMGAIGEKPELAGRALIFVGLAEGIAIYGLIIAIMILGKV